MPTLASTLRLAALALLILSLSACKSGFGRSGNANLATLSVSGVNISPSFSSDERNYTARVSLTTETVNVTATLDDSTATMSINGDATQSGVAYPVTLIEGENEIRVAVVAENESRRAYVIIITRTSETSDDAELASLDVAYTGIADEFARTSDAYTADVNFWVNATYLTVERSNEFAAVTPSTQTEILTDNEASEPITLALGDSTITLDVLAGDLTATESYTVSLTRSDKGELTVADYVKSEEPSNGDFFGSAIAVDNDTLVVGAPGNDSANDEDSTLGGAIDSGAVFVFERSNSDVWQETAYIKAEIASGSQITSGEAFGSSVAISGDYLAVGAPGTDTGTDISTVTEYVYLYERTTGGTAWTFVDRFAQGDANPANAFGTAITLNNDFLIVGAPNSGTTGSVTVIARDGDDWEVQTPPISPESTVTITEFGRALQLNRFSTRTEFIVGAPGSNNGEGRAFHYQYDTEDEEWSLIDEFVASNADDNDRFGEAVSILRHRVAIGAPQEDSNATGPSSDPLLGTDGGLGADSGAVYIFTRDDISDQTWEESAYLKAQESGAMAFGSTVALSANMLAVGAPAEDSDATGIDDQSFDLTNLTNSGAAYVFSVSGSSWTQESFIKASNPSSEDAFGTALDFFGNFLVVGATGEDGNAGSVGATDNNNGTDVGAVYIVR